jgi:hypothetical protein
LSYQNKKSQGVLLLSPEKLDPGVSFGFYVSSHQDYRGLLLALESKQFENSMFQVYDTEHEMLNAQDLARTRSIKSTFGISEVGRISFLTK